MNMKKSKISNNVIRRLPKYLHKADELIAAGVNRISSSELSEQLGFTASQIRQDFSNFGEFGQQGYGYDVRELRAQMAQIMGLDRGYNAILVGVGHIGRALMDNFCFSEWGFNLTRAFDVNPELIGKEFGGVKVSSMDELLDFLKKNDVDMAVLAVTAESASAVGKVLMKNGVNAIWNFTNVELTGQQEADDVIVENISFSDSLMALGYYMTEDRDG